MSGETDVTAGVDIGGTNTAVGIIDGNGRELATETIPTDARGGAESFVRKLASVINQLCEAPGVSSRLRGIGIASPAANYREGTIQSPANLAWGTINIVEMMKEFFDLPIAIINDANAAALGEMYFGSAQGMKNFIVITLGTGLGVGIVAHGVLVQGENSAAGEVGHIIVDPRGRFCGCGRRGCIETYVSASGLRRTVCGLLAERLDESGLRSISFNNLTAETVSRLADEGDSLAVEALRVTGDYLGRLLANLVATFDPEAVVLLGGLVKAGELLLGPTREAFEKHALPVYQQKVQILVSALASGKAAVLGASTLVSDTLLRVEGARTVGQS